MTILLLMPGIDAALLQGKRPERFGKEACHVVVEVDEFIYVN
jgi:hypothetical protein